MLPQEVLSTAIHARTFQIPRDIPKRPLIDYDYGGVAIQDPSQGLLVKIWTAEYIEEDIVFSAPGVAPTTVVTVPGITEFQFTFDQNMQPFVTYMVDEVDAFYYWFDPTIPGFDTVALPAGVITPRCVLDDKRAMAGVLFGASDIILAYVRAGSLYFRAQRDRFDTEYELFDGAGPGGLIQVGMNRVWRLQFLLATSS